MLSLDPKSPHPSSDFRDVTCHPICLRTTPAPLCAPAPELDGELEGMTLAHAFRRRAQPPSHTETSGNLRETTPFSSRFRRPLSPYECLPSPRHLFCFFTMAFPFSSFSQISLAASVAPCGRRCVGPCSLCVRLSKLVFA